MKTVLLITSSNISDKDSSWLVIKKFIKYLINTDLIICTTGKNKLSYNETDITYIHVNSNSIFKNILIRKTINKTNKKLNIFIYKYLSSSGSKEIINILEKRRVELIWTIASIEPILILDKIIEKSKVPYHITVFDDPLTNSEYNYYPDFTEIFIRIMAGAKSIDIPSINLYEYYVKNYIYSSTKPYSFSYCGIFQYVNNQARQLIKSKVSKICITGNIFGLGSLTKFLEAIKTSCLKQNITIHIHSNADKLTLLILKQKLSYYKHFVFFEEFISEEEVTQIISRYDLLLLPVSFSLPDMNKAKFSFPSKTHNYLAVGIPILLFAPEYAAIFNFLVENNLCIPIKTLEEDEIEKMFIDSLEYESRSIISNNIQKYSKNLAKNLHMKQWEKVLLKI